MEIYHIFNRGVDKRDVFLDDQDRARFVHDLFEFNDVDAARPNLRRHALPMFDVRRRTWGANKKQYERKLLVYIHAFALMPNHFHLLLSSAIEDGIALFMKKLGGGYTKYFNERYNRSGVLFQGKYKSVHIKNDAQFLYIPFYIHFNPLDLSSPAWRTTGITSPKKAKKALREYRWSSHLDYLGEKNFPSVTQRDFLKGSLGGPKQYARKVDKMLGTDLATELVDVMLE